MTSNSPGPGSNPDPTSDPGYVGDACDGHVPRDLSWLQEICEPISGYTQDLDLTSEHDILVALTLNAAHPTPGSSDWPALAGDPQSIASMRIEIDPSEPLALVHVPASLSDPGWNRPHLPYDLASLREAPIGARFETGSTLLARLPDTRAVVLDHSQLALDPGYYHLVRLRQDRRAAPLEVRGTWSLTYTEGTSYCRWTTTPPPSVGLYPRLPVCGDGLREAGEACDDGNNRADDGCRACQVEPLRCIDESDFSAWSCEGESVDCLDVDCGAEPERASCQQIPEQTLRVRASGRLFADEQVPARILDEAAGLDCQCTEGVRASCTGTCRWLGDTCQSLTLDLLASTETLTFTHWTGVDCPDERCELALDRPREVIAHLDTGRHQVERQEPQAPCYDLQPTSDGSYLGWCPEGEGLDLHPVIKMLASDRLTEVWRLDLSTWGDARPLAMIPAPEGGAFVTIEAVDPMVLGCQPVAQDQSILVRVSPEGEVEPIHLFEQFEVPYHLLQRQDGTLVAGGAGPRPDRSWGLSLALLSEEGAVLGQTRVGLNERAAVVRLAEDGLQIAVLTTRPGLPSQAPIPVTDASQAPEAPNTATLRRLDPDTWRTLWRQEWLRSRDSWRQGSMMAIGAQGHIAITDRFHDDPVPADTWGVETMERVVAFGPEGEVLWTALLDAPDICRLYDHSVVADPASGDFTLIGTRECLGRGFDGSTLVVERVGPDGTFRWSERIEAMRPFQEGVSFWGFNAWPSHFADDGRLVLASLGAAAWPEEAGDDYPHFPVWLLIDE